MTSDEFRISVRTAVLSPTHVLNGTFRAILEHLVDMPERTTTPAFEDVAIRDSGIILARAGKYAPLEYVWKDHETPYIRPMLTYDILEFTEREKLAPRARFLLLELVAATVIDGLVFR